MYVYDDLITIHEFRLLPNVPPMVGRMDIVSSDWVKFRFFVHIKWRIKMMSFRKSYWLYLLIIIEKYAHRQKIHKESQIQVFFFSRFQCEQKIRVSCMSIRFINRIFRRQKSYATRTPQFVIFCVFSRHFPEYSWVWSMYNVGSNVKSTCGFFQDVAITPQ